MPPSRLEIGLTPVGLSTGADNILTYTEKTRTPTRLIHSHSRVARRCLPVVEDVVLSFGPVPEGVPDRPWLLM